MMTQLGTFGDVMSSTVIGVLVVVLAVACVIIFRKTIFGWLKGK